MKIGIVTFQETNNYGALLQNYALQQALIKCGADSETIDYKSEYIAKPYKLLHLKNKGLFTYLFGVVGYIIYLLRTKKCKQFKKYIRYSKPIKKYELSKFNDCYDLFITGSDQVFNHKLTGGDLTYLLDFVHDKSKCMSYAASLGLNRISDEYVDAYRSCLENYSILTVREEGAAALLKKTLSRDVYPVSDPCVLLTIAEWEKIAVKPTIKKRYVLVYELGFSPAVVALAKTIAKKENLKMVFVPFPVGGIAGGKWECSIGPHEIIGYILNAEYIVTDSFHGTLLSIIFNKSFYSRIADVGVGSRIKDLLSHYGLDDRLITDGKCEVEKIDYEKIKAQIDVDRKESLAVLDEFIKSL